MANFGDRTLAARPLRDDSQLLLASRAGGMRGSRVFVAAGARHDPTGRPAGRLLLAGACLPGAAGAAELALTRVMLSSGGVGYVEYAGEPDGTPLGLDVPLDQVDDVLKSLVVFDAAGGVGGFSLPGKDGTREAFGDVPIGPAALASPVEFLNGLRGVAVARGPARWPAG